jgi:cephalosporin hydroxylase
MTSAMWRHTGAIWPMGVPTSLTWYDMGAVLNILQIASIRTVLEIGVEHGGLSSVLIAHGKNTGVVYRGIDITLEPLHPVIPAGLIDQRDAWDAATVREMGLWLATQPAPALIICDGGDKPKELHLYAPLLRPGDVMIGHDYHNEYDDTAIATVPATQVCAEWLDDTLLCMWVAQ